MGEKPPIATVHDNRTTQLQAAQTIPKQRHFNGKPHQKHQKECKE